MDNLNELLLELQKWGAEFSLKLVAAIALLFLGFRFIRVVRRTFERWMSRAEVDQTLIRFSSNALHMGLTLLLGVVALGQMGVETASFIALIGSAGLAIGFALQGSLGNLAAGVLIILFRPFRVGDYIEGAGAIGTVEEIQLFVTQLVTQDNCLIFIPNGSLISSNITNYSAKPQRRVDLVFSVHYGENLDRVRQAIQTVALAESRILADLGVEIGVLEWAEHGLKITVRSWVNTSDYWPVYFALLEAIKTQFDIEGIHIPHSLEERHCA